MSDSIIIHIGYHKSASTLFQKSIFPFLPAEYMLLEQSHLTDLHMVEGFDEKTFRNKVLEKIPSRTIDLSLKIISNEQLSGHPHGYDTIDPYQIANRLKGSFPDAKIFILVRNQLKYITSVYTYRVAIKGYERRNFSTFLAEEVRLGLGKALLYDRLINYYQNLFGADQICVLPIELLKFDEVKFKELFFDFFSIPPQELKINERVNESTKLVAILKFWRASNHMFYYLFAIYKQLVKDQWRRYRFRYRYYEFKLVATAKLNRLFKKGKQLDITIFEEYPELINEFSASNEVVSKLIGLDLKKLGYF